MWNFCEVHKAINAFVASTYHLTQEFQKNSVELFNVDTLPLTCPHQSFPFVLCDIRFIYVIILHSRHRERNKMFRVEITYTNVEGC